MSRPNCNDCRYYYITWNPKTPNGCRRYGIQCKERPTSIVAQAGMGECQGFEPKKRPVAENKKGLDLNREDLW